MATFYKKKLHENPNLKFKVGFNHRFHPALWEAKHKVDEGVIGNGTGVRINAYI